MTIYHSIEYFLVNYGYTLEMVFAIAVFACYLERKNHFMIRLSGSYCLILMYYIPFRHVSQTQNLWLQLLFYILMNVVLYLAISICFCVSSWARLFVLTGADLVQHISYRIYCIVISFLGIGYEGILSGIINICIIASVYLTVFLIFRRQLRSITEHAYIGRMNILLGIMAFMISYALFRFEDRYRFMWTDPWLNLLFAIYAILADMFLLALLYSVFRSRKMGDEMVVLEEVIERQKIQYQMTKENIDNVNLKCHDMKQQISMFENRIDGEALQEIKSMIRVYDTTFQTGNEVLDVFLQEKLLCCERDQIKLDCIVDGKCVEFIRPADLYALVGNAIDNAVEAVKRIENPEKRIISFSVRKSMNMALIHVDNEYVGKIEMEGNLPKSTKGDPLNHGFGMRSMSLIAEKYNGTVSVAVEGNVFNLNILIPFSK